MPRLSELGLTNEAVGENLDYETMTDQFGAYPDPPQPGTFRFRFPVRVDDLNWELFDHDKGRPPGKRVRVKFDDAHPLTIIQSPGESYNGEPFMTNFSNAERARGKKDDPTVQYIADMDYINRDVWGLKGKPNGNKGYADTFLKYAAVPPTNEFTADIEWSWYCNDKKDIFIDNGQGGYTQVTGTKGCGTSYYQKDIAKVRDNPDDPNSPMVFPLRIQCQCGANVRAFPNLTRYRK